MAKGFPVTAEKRDEVKGLAKANPGLTRQQLGKLADVSEETASAILLGRYDHLGAEEPGGPSDALRVEAACERMRQALREQTDVLASEADALARSVADLNAMVAGLGFILCNMVDPGVVRSKETASRFRRSFREVGGKYRDEQ